MSRRISGRIFVMDFEGRNAWEISNPLVIGEWRAAIRVRLGGR